MTRYKLVKHYYNTHGQVKEFELRFKRPITSVLDARKLAMKTLKDDMGSVYGGSVSSIVIYGDGKDLGAVRYEKSTREYWWYSNRKADPEKKYHMRLILKNGSFSKRTLFDNI